MDRRVDDSSGSFKVAVAQPRFGLRRVFFLLGVVATLVFGVVFGLFFYQSSQRELREEFRQRGLIMARNLAFNARYGTLIGDRDILGQLVDGVAAESIVAYVRILDLGGAVLAQRGPQGGVIGPLVRDSAGVGSGLGLWGSEVLDISLPVTATKYTTGDDELQPFVEGDGATPTRVVGRVVVGVSLAEVAQRTRGIIVRLGWLLVALMALGLGAAYWLSGTLAGPITELASAALDIAGGSLDRRVEVRGRGELAILGHAFNRMASALAQRTDELSRTAARLEEMVRVRTEQLRTKAEELERRNLLLLEQNEQIREADRLKSEFLATVSHELRTPLNSIIGFSSLLLGTVSGRLEAEEREDLLSVNRSGRHLLTIISSILDLSRIEAGRLALDRGRVDAAAVVEDVVRSLGGAAHAKGLQLAVELPGSLPQVWADSTRLWQILENLLSNAVKYSERGRIVVSAAVCKGRAEHEEMAELDYVEFSVADEGIGISENDRESIFQAFRQVDSSTTRRQQGLGLGLAIARRLVLLHGGHMELTSMVSVGSTFSFTIPVAGERLSLDPEGAATVGCPGAGGDREGSGSGS